MYTWIRLQSEVGQWVQKNFPKSPARHQVWGLVEELGELTHAHLKGEQGIRGSSEKHIAAGKDAVADSIIFFMSACTLNGWASQVVLDTSSPEEFQARFSAVHGHSTITQILTNLANMVAALDMAEFAQTQIEKDTYINGAKSAAQLYVAGLAAHCTKMGWSLQTIIEDVWSVVQKRDWTVNKVDGSAALGDLVDETGNLKPGAARDLAKELFPK